MGAGTWERHHAITTLMYRYAECVDQADFFAERTVHVDPIGNMSEHLSFDLAEGSVRYDEVVPPKA
jgi:hypothetical protein